MDQDHRILFHSEISDFHIQDEDSLRYWLEAVADAESKSIEAVNYVFMSDEELLLVNREYLNHDYYTDVISFPLSSDPIEGDIFISIDRVRDNATSLHISFLQELRRIIVHGLLHFLGYQDNTPEDRLSMTQKEDEYLTKYPASLP